MCDAATAVAGPTPVESPDWSQITDEITCPLCRYNLRGLNLPRCPECGYHFTWTEVLDPHRREHPYLFEHHADRNVWSYWKTVTGALRPKRFWNSLHPVQPSRPGRLLLYWVVGMLLLGLPGMILWASPGMADVAAAHAAQRAWLRQINRPESIYIRRDVLQRYGTLQAALKAECPIPPVLRAVSGAISGHGVWSRDLHPGLGAGLAAVIAWPWLTFMALMVFQMSMRQARVDYMHVVRCVTYSYDLLPATVVALVQAALISCMPYWGRFSADRLLTILFIAGMIVMVFYGLRIWRAYQLYLRFDRPFLTVLASQVITILVLLNIGAGLVQWARS